MRASLKRGFLLMTSLFVLSGLASLMAVGLTRTVVELRGATYYANKAQAFHTAEAGLDGYLMWLRRSVAGTVNQTLNSLTTTQNLPCNDVPNCTILEVRDDVEADEVPPDLSKDSNQIIVIKVRGVAGAVSETIQAAIYVDTGNPIVYPYSVAGKIINMDGTSTFGDPLAWDKTIIYAQGPPDSNGSFLTTSTNNVWAGRIAFYNPTSASLAALCQNCSNQSIFHRDPSKPLMDPSGDIAFDITAPKAPDPVIDLKPYYDEAVRQGQVISANRTFDGETLTGIYYVECGISIELKGTVTVNGTIVHEGCGGIIELRPHATLNLDSTAGLSPFSPGMAIIGAPKLIFAKEADMEVKGLVMTRGGDVTNIKATGTIRGSLIAVEDAGASHPDLVNGPGPGSESLVMFSLSKLGVENAQIVFSAISGSGPTPPVSGVIAQLRAWIQEDPL